MSGKNPFEVVGFETGDNVVLVDNTTKTRSIVGFIFQIDYGTITVRVNGCEVEIEGDEFQGKTAFGPCTMVKA